MTTGIVPPAAMMPAAAIPGETANYMTGYSGKGFMPGVGRRPVGEPESGRSHFDGEGWTAKSATAIWTRSANPGPKRTRRTTAIRADQARKIVACIHEFDGGGIAPRCLCSFGAAAGSATRELASSCSGRLRDTQRTVSSSEAGRSGRP
jgi:hypothetical protein